MNQNLRLISARGAVAWPPLSRQRIRDAAVWAWRSPRLFAFILLTLAVILGAFYRFHWLTRWDINGDEAVAWVAVIKPSLHKVVKTFWQVEYGGKLPLFDIVLHEWIRIFGDSLFAMRAMSAALGTIAIVLVFVAVREICRSLGGEAAAEAGEVAGAFAALIYALNSTMVVSDRTAREFPVLIGAELLQIIFFVRAQRRATWVDYLGIAIFTAIALATNYTACFLLLAEALWLGCLLAAKLAGSAGARRLAVFRPGLGVLAGIALLAPFVTEAYTASRDAVAAGSVDFIKPQPISWLFTVMRAVGGKPALFHILVALIVFGVWWQWRSGRPASGFLAAWMVGPVLAACAVTYLIRPIELPRYVMIAFVGMFAFAGFGAASVRSTAVRILLAITIVYMSAPTLHRSLRASRSGDWREATALADHAAAGGQIAVYLPYCVQVVRFYLPLERRTAAVGLGGECGPATVLILSGRSFAPRNQIAAAEACYPRVVAKLHLVEVRTR